MTLCKYYHKCYFPKDIAKGMHGKEGIKRYLDSCNFDGMDCELAKLSEIEFKIFERVNENEMDLDFVVQTFAQQPIKSNRDYGKSEERE